MIFRFRQICALLLITTLLLTSSGFVIGKMVCLRSGKTLFQLNGVNGVCCPTEQSNQKEFRDNCCITTNYTITTDHYVGNLHLKIKPAPVIGQAMFNACICIADIQYKKSSAQNYPQPPPKTGWLLRQLHYSFLI